MASPVDIDDLVQKLADGFDSLLGEVRRLSQRQQELEQTLRAASEYAKSTANSTANNPDSDTRPPLNKSLDALAFKQPTNSSQVFLEEKLCLQDAPPQVQESIRRASEAHRALKEYLRRKTPPKAPAACPFSGHIQTEEMERDFTTPGVTGNLQCPFSKMGRSSPSGAAQSRRGLPTPPNNDHIPNKHDLDPIKTEPPPNNLSSPPPSLSPTANKCPIRFLDKESPEEVARYFEEHKHEIPRSHAVCVKRHQQNRDSIRQLDAKYGNLVTMIQGLGEKHQAYLPAQDGEEGLHRGPSSAEVVEKWAENVSHKAEDPVEILHTEEEEFRSGRFQRSLREVRVGESPSRPWGIPVPPEHHTPSINLSISGNEEHFIPDIGAPQNEDVPAAETEGDLKQDSPTIEEPFEKPSTRVSSSLNHATHSTHTGNRTSRSKNKKTSATMGDRRKASPQPQMVFTGPVFFGYSAEQAVGLMQHGGSGGHQPFPVR